MKLKANQIIENIVSKDDTRYPLTFLHIVPCHPILKCPAIEATDGRRYVAIPVELEHGDTGDFLRADLIPIARDAYERNHRLGCSTYYKKVSISLGEEWTETIDKARRPRTKASDVGHYPGTTNIFPRFASETIEEGQPAIVPHQPEPVTHIHVNAEMLADMQKAMGAEGVTLTFYGEHSAIEVEPLENTSKGYGCIMPMRRD